MRETFNADAIDLAVSTHSDSDHAGGLPFVVANIEVRELWIHRPHDDRNALVASARNVADIISQARQWDVPIKEPFSDNQELCFPGLYVLGPSTTYFAELLATGMYTDSELEQIADSERVLASASSPDRLAENPTTSARNNSSTILLLKLEGIQLMLTGDAGVEALSNAEPLAIDLGYDPQIAIVQIPHHGSSNSLNEDCVRWMAGDKTEVIDKRAFVTAAVNDQFGFPHTAVTDSFIDRGWMIPVPSKQNRRFFGHFQPDDLGGYTGTIQWIQRSSRN